jgi:plastocyanin
MTRAVLHPSALLRLVLFASTALLAVIALGPGSSRAEATAKPGPTSKPVTITMRDFSYTPASITVKVGQSVRFVNRGKIGHTVADVDARGTILGKAIKPKLLDAGQSQTVTFSKPGRIPYLCTLHPTLMKGVIVVEP